MQDKGKHSGVWYCSSSKLKTKYIVLLRFCVCMMASFHVRTWPIILGKRLPNHDVLNLFYNIFIKR